MEASSLFGLVSFGFFLLFLYFFSEEFTFGVRKKFGHFGVEGVLGVKQTTLIRKILKKGLSFFFGEGLIGLEIFHFINFFIEDSDAFFALFL
jgi:hypothetical protein